MVARVAFGEFLRNLSIILIVHLWLWFILPFYCLYLKLFIGDWFFCYVSLRLLDGLKALGLGKIIMKITHEYIKWNWHFCKKKFFNTKKLQKFTHYKAY